MLPSRLVIALAALASSVIAVAAHAQAVKNRATASSAPEIPAKYRGVYARTPERCKMQEDSIHVPWLVVTAKAVHRDESLCKVTAVKPNMTSNADSLSFACAEEGTESTEEEAWSLEFKTEGYGNVKVSQQYLVRRGIKSGKVDPKDVSRLMKCGLQAIERP